MKTEMATEEIKEDLVAFKGYQRGLLRHLTALKNTLKAEDYTTAVLLVDELIEDTKNNIED